MLAFYIFNFSWCKIPTFLNYWSSLFYVCISELKGKCNLEMKTLCFIIAFHIYSSEEIIIWFVAGFNLGSKVVLFKVRNVHITVVLFCYCYCLLLRMKP